MASQTSGRATPDRHLVPGIGQHQRERRTPRPGAEHRDLRHLLLLLDAGRRCLPRLVGGGVGVADLQHPGLAGIEPGGWRRLLPDPLEEPRDRVHDPCRGRVQELRGDRLVAEGRRGRPADRPSRGWCDGAAAGVACCRGRGSRGLPTGPPAPPAPRRSARSLPHPSCPPSATGRGRGSTCPRGRPPRACPPARPRRRRRTPARRPRSDGAPGSGHWSGAPSRRRTRRRARPWPGSAARRPCSCTKWAKVSGSRCEAWLATRTAPPRRGTCSSPDQSRRVSASSTGLTIIDPDREGEAATLPRAARLVHGFLLTRGCSGRGRSGRRDRLVAARGVTRNPTARRAPVAAPRDAWHLDGHRDSSRRC